VLGLRDGTRKNQQASLTHTGLHTTHTKWLVHNWSTLGARMSHEQHEHTRLTTARTWGKPPPSPFYNILCASPWGPHPNGFFFSRLPSGGPKTTKVRSLATLDPHNFESKPWIEMKSKAKL
jgi:hypothetical protein